MAARHRIVRNRIVATKLEPPVVLRPASVRPELLERIPVDARYVAIVAPPGYGKTVLAREIHAGRPPGTAAWLSVDLLDRQPYAFWTHLIATLQGTAAEIDDEPDDLLTERPTSDLTFLASLCEQLRRSAEPVTLVLDDVDRIDDPDVMAGLAHLGEWADGRLQLILTGRLDPKLPLARWRSEGTLVEVREDDLRFDREATHRFVAAVAPGLLGPDDVDALHDRVEGWPVALQVALLVAREADDPAAAAREIAGTDRLVADYLTGEVLDALTDTQREVALGLSVLDWVDLDLCRSILGADAVPVVRELVDRHFPLTELVGRERFRFHSLIRELLEVELRWRDPDRAVQLHRRAGEALLDRGDRFAAAAHFVAIGDHDRASEVVAGPAMALVDQGMFRELRRSLAQLPSELHVTGAGQVVDLAFAELITGRRSEAERWIRRAEELAPTEDPVRLQLLMLLVAQRVVAGDNSVGELVAEIDRLRPSAGPEVGSRVDAVIARHAVLFGTDDVDERILALRPARSPRAAIGVLAPALESTVALERDDVATAVQLASLALERSRQLSSEPHPAMFDALLAAGWSAWATGSFDRARELSDRAFAHPLGIYPMWWVRVATLAVECLARTGSARAAIELLDQLDPGELRYEHISTRAGLARARATVAARRHDEARALLASIPPSPERDLLSAWTALGLGHVDEAGELVADRDSWPARLRIEALVVASCLADGSAPLLGEAVALASRTAWVAPLLGHGRVVTDRLRRLPLATMHPALDAALGRSDPEVRTSTPIELTDRERTLLALLPTHLSYGQMGAELYVSVNTVKSNLKSVYRKLGARTRDEAIRAARAAGLLDVG